MAIISVQLYIASVYKFIGYIFLLTSVVKHSYLIKQCINTELLLCKNYSEHIIEICYLYFKAIKSPFK